MDEAEMDDALNALWERHRGTARERVDLIADAAVALLGNELTPELREQAERASHQLAGSLGTFRRPQGTEVARELERILGEPVSYGDASRAAELAEELRRIIESESATAGASPEAVAVVAGEGTASIVALDEDPAILDAVETALRSGGYRITTVADQAEILEVLDRIEPDLLLLDIDMPGRSGIEVCRALRAEPRWRSLPIVFLTAAEDPRDISAAFAAGGDDFIAKPVQADELLKRVRNRLARPVPAAAAAVGTADDDRRFDVLLVEDDEALADLLMQVLETRGMTARVIPDGMQASVELLGPEHLRPRVLLLDIGLPGLDGLSLLRQLTAEGRDRDTRVIMLTARASETEVLRALDLGAIDHVGKPFSVPVLMHKVETAVAAAER